MKIEDLTLKQIKEVCDKHGERKVFDECKGCPFLTDVHGVKNTCLFSSPILLIALEDLEREINPNE